MEKKAFQILEISQAQRIGSSAIEDIKYSADVDLQEKIFTDKTYEDILKVFQEKFKEAKTTPNVWITDFKCGVIQGSYPIRWTYDTIMQGYQYLNGDIRYFTTCLQQQSIIKMDLFTLEKGEFTEYSENYYFTFPNNFSTEVNKGDIPAYLIKDYYKYIQEGRRFKALKRLFSYYKYKGKENERNKLIEFFNSGVGKFNQQINALKIILDVMDNTFKPVRLTDIKSNLKIIKRNVPDNYKMRIQHSINQTTHEAVKKTIEDIVKSMEKQIDLEVDDYIKLQKFSI